MAEKVRCSDYFSSFAIHCDFPLLSSDLEIVNVISLMNCFRVLYSTNCEAVNFTLYEYEPSCLRVPRSRISIAESAVMGLSWIQALIALVASSSESTPEDAPEGADEGPEDLEQPAETSANTITANKAATNFVSRLIHVLLVLISSVFVYYHPTGTKRQHFLLSLSWIECVAYPFAEEVVAEDGNKDCKAGEGREPPGNFDIVLARRQEAAPGRRGRLDAEAEEA